MAPISPAEHARGGAPAASSPPVSCELVIRPSSQPSLGDRNSRQACERFAVLVARARDDLGWQFRSRRLLVPVECFQVVAYELLVEARRARARAGALTRPATPGGGRAQARREPSRRA